MEFTLPCLLLIITNISFVVRMFAFKNFCFGSEGRLEGLAEEWRLLEEVAVFHFLCQKFGNWRTSNF